jgi:hypothetical protein
VDKSISRVQLRLNRWLTRDNSYRKSVHSCKYLMITKMINRKRFSRGVSDCCLKKNWNYLPESGKMNCCHARRHQPIFESLTSPWKMTRNTTPVSEYDQINVGADVLQREVSTTGKTKQRNDCRSKYCVSGVSINRDRILESLADKHKCLIFFTSGRMAIIGSENERFR